MLPSRHQYLVVAALLAGCATQTRGSRPTGLTPDARTGTGGAMCVLTRADVEAAVGVSNVGDAIRQLRPAFLRSNAVWVSSSGRSAAPAVYIDDHLLGDVDQLGSVPIAIFNDARLMSASEASVRYGSACPCRAGVIAIRTIRKM